MAIQTIKLNTNNARDIAKGIGNSLTGNIINIDKAKQDAEELYREAIEFAVTDTQDHPVLTGVNDIMVPVVDEFNQFVSSGGIQSKPTLHLSLGKAYRIFIEITWNQCWRHKRLIYTSTRGNSIQNSDTIRAVNQDQAEIWFEYSCAKQAAKCLIPAVSPWKAYIEPAIDLAVSIQGKSIFGIIKNLLAIGKIVRKNWVSRWYLPVYHLRWNAANIRRPAGFNAILGPHLQTFQQKGKNYTLCLATIFRDLIVGKNIDAQTKTLAIEGFVNLLHLKDTDAKSGFLNYIIEKMKKSRMQAIVIKLAIKADRYWQTHYMIIQYIFELNRDPVGKQYIDQAKTALMSIQRKATLQALKLILQSEFNECLSRSEKDRADTMEYIEQCRAFLQSAGLGVVKAGQDKEVQETTENLEKSLKEQKEIEEEIEKIKTTQDSIFQGLEKLGKTEEGYYTDLAKICP